MDISVGYNLVWEEHVVKYIVQIRANGFQDLWWELLSHKHLSAPGFGTDGVATMVVELCTLWNFAHIILESAFAGGCVCWTDTEMCVVHNVTCITGVSNSEVMRRFTRA